MNTGRTLFAQVMDFVPWTSFQRLVTRYGGDTRVRTLHCTEQFRAMAFAQMTYRESLRDIEACLGAQPSKLYAMGFRHAVAKSTLADANETRDWRLWHDLAVVLIRRARKLYTDESIGLDLDNTVYALDSTTIDLCLSLFPGADFRSTKAAVKMHTLLDLRGPIPSFIHVSNGKMGDARALDLITPEAGAIYVMDRGYLDFRRLHTLHAASAFFVTRAKRNMTITGAIPGRRTKRRASSLTRQSRLMVSMRTRTILNICGEFVTATRRRARSSSSSPTISRCRPRPSPPFTKSAGTSNCFSSGSSRTSASNISSARPRMP